MRIAQEYLKFLLGGGDPEDILQELIAEYEKDVWNYAFTLTKIYDRADDITQDVFVKVYRNLYSFRGESSVKTWLLSITRHTAYNYLKSAFFRKVTLFGFVLDRRNHASAEEEALDRIVTEDIWKMVLDLGQKVKIIGLSKKTGQIFNVFSAVIPRDYEGQSVDGIHINMPSGLSLPLIGLWRLYVIVGDKYFDSVIVDVN